MIRKFNYTGRQKINRSHIHVTLGMSGDNKVFNANLDIGDLGFDPEASVYVEPYYKSSFMRFNFGTVGNIKIPNDRSITDLPTANNVLFRVKVVDESGQHGKLLGLADRIRPQDIEEIEQAKQSILWVEFDKDLDQQVWRISFENAMPTIEINSRVKNAVDLVRKDGAFFALVFPAAIHQVVSKLIFEGEVYDGVGDTWQDLWIRFIKDVLMVGDMPEEEEEIESKEMWIEDVVAAFCRHYLTRNKFETSKLGGWE